MAYTLLSFSFTRCLLSKAWTAYPLRGARSLPNPKTSQKSATRQIWNKLFGKYLLITNVVSSGILMVVGDLAAQELEFRRELLLERYDKSRIYRMFVVGSLQGPLHHFGYAWMDKTMPDATLRNTIKKILIDQLVMSPMCIIIFFYPACYLEGKNLKETNKEVVEKFPYIYMADWLVWPAAQFVNFRYLQPKYRVVFVNVMTAIYNIFMSYIKHDESGHFLEKFT